ncbi:MAG: AAA family ATPase [Nannocystaceae bacterium]
MEIADLIAALAAPEAFPGIRADRVEVIQTHISAVFLVGEHVFKVKKPLRLPFLDYSTRERRRALCEAEVALGRRLAPDVYLGVVEITCSKGQVRVGGDAGEVIDHAVHMRRLPDDHTLGAWLERGALPAGAIEALGRRLADFHAEAAGGPSIARYAEYEAVAGNVTDNFTEMAALAEAAPLGPDLAALRARSEAELARRRPLLAARAARGIARECHGDLRLDHVYLFPGRPPPGDLVILDGIEFNEAFRASDPAADLAFLVMDLRLHGFADEADALVRAYLARSGDHELAALLPLYVAYRATVRTKVELYRAGEAEIAADAREEARALARRHLDLALAALEPAAGDERLEEASTRGAAIASDRLASDRTASDRLASDRLASDRLASDRLASDRLASDRIKSNLAPSESAPSRFDPSRSRPSLLLVAGLPGAGKSTLARNLSQETGARVIRSDVVRKRLAGIDPEAAAGVRLSGAHYSAAWTEATYAACLEEARARLGDGEAVIVDANFRTDAQRRPFLALARELGVPARLLVAEVPEAVALARIAGREGDASDADAEVYRRARATWEAPGAELAGLVVIVDASGPSTETLARARAALAEVGVATSARTTSATGSRVHPGSTSS